MKTRLRRPQPWRFPLFFALALIFQLETLLVGPRQDSAAWRFMAARQSHGQMPARDLWDNKLPLIYLIGRAATATGHPPAFLWILEALLTAAGAAAGARMIENPHSRQRQRAGAIAGALVCIAAGATSFHAGGYMTETYAMPLSALAALATWHMAKSKRAFSPALIAAVLWTLAVSFRLPLAPTAIAVVAYALVIGERAQRAARLVGLALGGGLAALVILAHPFFADYLHECIDAAIRWPLGIAHPTSHITHRTSHIPAPLAPTAAARWADWAQDAARLGWLHLAAIAGYLLTFHGLLSRLARIGLLWYLAAMASALLGWASYAHYQYVAIAPAALGCGLLICRLQPFAARRVATALIAITVAVVGTQESQVIIRHGGAPLDPDESAIAACVREQTDPSDSVFLWTWGRSARLLYELDRSPGVRHFLAHAYLDMDAALFDDFVDELAAAPPDWIVEDTTRDDPSLSSSDNPALEARVPSLPRLHDIVRRRYKKHAELGRFILWQMRNPAPMNATSSPTP